jgi:predicted permease
MLIMFLTTFLLTRVVMPSEVKQNKGIYLTTCFMNTAGMGFPVTLLILGEAAFAYAVIMDLTMIMAMFTLGVWLMDRSSGVWGPFKLPVIYAAAAGFLFNYFDIQTPGIILHVIEMLAGLTVPLLLISLGARLSELKVDKFKLRTPLKATGLRLLGGLLLALLITSILDFPTIVKQAFILYAVLPAPLMSYVLTSKYHHNDIVIAETILLSTAASFVLIPLVVHYIH